MEKESKPIKPLPKNRVTLSEESVARLNRWESQINERYRGMGIRIADLVEWLIMNRSEALSPNELKDLQGKYWDEIAMTSWALKELKKAKSNGQAVTLQEVIAQNLGPLTKTVSKRKAKTETLESISHSLKEEPDVKTEV